MGGEHRPLDRLGRERIAGGDERPGAQRLDHRLPGPQLGRAVEHLDRLARVVLAEVDLPERDQALEVVGLGGQHQLERLARLDARRVVAVGEIHRDARLGAQDLRVGRREPARDAGLRSRPRRTGRHAPATLAYSRWT